MKMTYQNVWTTDRSVFIGKFIALNLYRESIHTTTVNILKTQETFSKMCGRYQHSNTVWEGQGFSCVQGKWCWERRQRGYGEQTKPIFQKKAETPEKIVLRWEWVEPKYRSKRTPAIKSRHFEQGGDNKRPNDPVWA